MQAGLLQARRQRRGLQGKQLRGAVLAVDATAGVGERGAQVVALAPAHLSLGDDPRVFVFLMDYANRRRVKLWGTARVVADDPELLASLHDADYRARPERAIVITIEAWDVNCPQHIHRRVREAEVTSLVESLRARIASLEKTIEELDGRSPRR